MVNVGKYTIHGCYGICLGFFEDLRFVLLTFAFEPFKFQLVVESLF